MINALGLLEVYGYTASIEAADAMLKTAHVRILSQTVTPPAMVSVIIEGDLAACRAALDAGAVAASRLGTVLVKKEIGRPDNGIEWWVTQLQNSSQPELAAINKAGKIEVDLKIEAELVSIDEVALLEFINRQQTGCNLTEIITHFDAETQRDEIKNMLKYGQENGLLRKRSNRYFAIETNK